MKKIMRTILSFIVVTFLLVACVSKTTKSERSDPNHSAAQNSTDFKFIDFTQKFKKINLPLEIGDSIVWLSTYVEMKGWKKIDSSDVNKFLIFEEETKNGVDFNDLIRFFNVGQFQVDTNIIALVYLKSYKSEYVFGGKKDVYKITTFTKSGKPISQLELAGFITDVDREKDKSYWNTCKIKSDLSIDLFIKEQLADYNKDTIYVLSKNRKNYSIKKDGKIE